MDRHQPRDERQLRLGFVVAPDGTIEEFTAPQGLLEHLAYRWSLPLVMEACGVLKGGSRCGS